MAVLSSSLLVLLAALAFGFVVVVARHSPRTVVEGTTGGAPLPAPGSPPPRRHPGRRLRTVLTRSFRETFAFLRSIIPGRRYAYAAPWFLLIGFSGAGKSTLLDSVERSTRVAVKPPQYRDQPETHTWRFFDTGVVLDVNGDILLHAGGAAAGEDEWEELLRLLRNFRPRRPLDGIALAVSCEDLLAQEELGRKTVAARADAFYQRLWMIQQHLGLCLPIYLILTKADCIPGFAGFAQALAAEHPHEIIGWSNPSDIATPLNPRLASIVMTHIGARFRQLHLDIAADVDNPPDGDGLLVFPGALQRLTGPVQAILGSLFRPSAYHEPFFLRGIYLSGVAHGSAEDGTVPSRETNGHLYAGDRLGSPDGSGAVTSERLPFFVRDLFNEKIFAETALAVAASGGPVRTARSVRVAQSALVLSVVLLGVGLTLETLRLDRGIDRLRPAFVAVDQGLAGLAQERPTTKEGQPAATRFPGAEAFLDGLADIDLKSLWSVWLPSSWFSSLHSQTVDFLSAGFTGVLLPATRRELQRRVEAAIGSIAALSQGDVTPPRLAVLAGSSDFERLNNSIRELIGLEATAKLFNRVNSGPELGDIARLADELLGIKVSPSFYENIDLYREALKEARVVPYSFGPDAIRAQDAVLAAFRSIEARFSDDGPIMSDLASLCTALGNLEAGSRDGADPGVTTAVVIALLARAQQMLNDPALAWITGKSIAQIPELDSLLTAMSQSAIFGPDITGALRKRLDADLHSLQQRLAALNAPEIGPLLDQQNGQIALKLAPPIARLSDQLSAMLKYAFMDARGDNEPQLAVNSAAIVIWDVDTLRTALDFYRGYEQFEANELAAAPRALTKPLDDFARQRLRGTMTRAIRIAAAGSPSNAGTVAPTATILDEGSVFHQAENFRRAAPMLGDIISVLQQLNFNEVAGQLRTLATKQAYDLLEEIDQLAEADELYLPQRSFAVANDNTSLLESAYLLRSDVEVAQYLDTERDRISRLAQGAAEAAVGFLGRSDIAGTMPMPLVGKWRGILTALRSYQNGDPSGSIGTLQNFIRFDLAAANHGNCPAGANANGTAADFFGQRLELLRREVAAVCNRVTLTATVTEYDQIAALFNQLLAGRYPFGPAGAAPVEIPNLIEFFHTFAAQEAAVRAALGTGAGVSGGPAALQFLDELDRASTFFAPLLAPPGNAGYDLTAAFRVNRRHEHGGDQIIDWSISAGDTSLQGDHPNGRWFPGDPVTVRLRWAKDAPSVPYGSAGEPQIDGTTAIFHYDGRWALLRLLNEHHAAPSEFDLGSADAVPNLLKFVIPVSVASAGGGAVPVGPSDRVTVFIHLGLAAPSANPQQAAILSVPDFPQRAPTLGHGGPMPLTSATATRFVSRPAGGK
jgi:type VI secretion system protein ImpL